MGMKVLGRATSINVRKVLWALEELGVHCQREDWGQPVRDPRVAEFMALNPNAQVPVIIEDGFVLWESHAILRYLSETRDGALLPAEARQRAIADQWLTWQATELNPAWSYAFRALVWRSPGYREQARIEESLGRWARMMAILEQRLRETGAFAAGKAFTLADISLGLSVHRWFRTPMDHPAMPAVDNYDGRLRARAAGGRWMTDDTP
jgi:glutathione S-transferase